MVDFLTTDDLLVFSPSINEDKAEAMIADATALALVVAPCIGADTFDHLEAVKAILRGAILRWDEAGSGAFQSTTAGPFGATVDTREARRGMFWPSEITQLQGLCASATGGSVYTVSLAGPDPVPGDGITLA